MTLLSVQTSSKKTTGGVGRAATSVLEWLLYTVVAFALIVGIGFLLGAVGNALHMGLPDAAYAVASVVVFIGLLLFDKFA